MAGAALCYRKFGFLKSWDCHFLHFQVNQATFYTKIKFKKKFFHPQKMEEQRKEHQDKDSKMFHPKDSTTCSPKNSVISHDMNHRLGYPYPTNSFQEIHKSTNTQDVVDFEEFSNHSSVLRSSLPGIKATDASYPSVQCCFQKMQLKELNHSCMDREKDNLYQEFGNKKNGQRSLKKEQSDDCSFGQHFFQRYDEISKELLCSASMFLDNILWPTNYAEESYESEVIHSLLDEKVFYHIWSHLDPSFRGSEKDKYTSVRTRMLSNEDNSVCDVTGKVYNMAKDQFGCRALQKMMTDGSRQDVGNIFREISGHFAELVAHSFGNYLIQKLLQWCDEDQIVQIINEITTNDGELVRISCSKHGTRVVQEIIKTIRSTYHASRIVSSLKTGVFDLIKNANGYRVVKHCLQYLTPDQTEFIFVAATENCIDLATNPYGCCVIKDSLDRFCGEKHWLLIAEIASNALLLSQDQYGNYVVQHVLQLNIPWATSEVFEQLRGEYVHLSKQKFSSNVVEKCIQYAGEQQLAILLQEFINDSQLDQMLKDRFGNFVLQTALHCSKGSLRAALIKAIQPHMPALRANPYGKKVISLVMSLRNRASHRRQL